MDFEKAYKSLMTIEEAAKKYATEWHENPDGSAWKPYFEVSAIKAFIAGAEWQAEHNPLPEDTVLFNKGVAEGKRLMMEEAVEKEVLQVTRKRPPVVVIRLDENKYKDGDKVRLIVLPKED